MTKKEFTPVLEKALSKISNELHKNIHDDVKIGQIIRNSISGTDSIKVRKDVIYFFLDNLSVKIKMRTNGFVQYEIFGVEQAKLINPVSKDTLKMKKSNNIGRKAMTKTETLNRAKEVFKAMTMDGVVAFDDAGTEVTIKTDGDNKVIQYGDTVYNIQGTKRVKLVEVKAKSAKKSKDPKPAQSEVVCEECGAKFMRSKFAPNQTKCADCRGTKKAPAEPIDKVCDICGEDFVASKFNPYITTCPACKKLARAEKAKANRLANKPAK